MLVRHFRESFLDKIMTPEPYFKTEEWLLWMKTFSDISYKIYPIKKPNGSTRIIEAPNPLLKTLQQSLLVEFSDYKRHDAAHGLDEQDFKQNALKHKNKADIFTLDLKDFYKNCTFKQLRARIKDPHIRDRVTQLAPFIFYAHKNARHSSEVFLSTGSPLSPVLSNLAVTNMDYEIQEIATSFEATYTRYLDDMNFSFEQKVPEHTRNEFFKRITTRVQSDKWRINWKKTKWLNPNEDAIVITGVDLRSDPKVTRRYIKDHIRPGLNDVAKAKYIQAEDSKFDLLPAIQKEYPSLHGSLVYIRSINEDQYLKLLEYFFKRARVASSKAEEE